MTRPIRTRARAASKRAILGWIAATIGPLGAILAAGIVVAALVIVGLGGAGQIAAIAGCPPQSATSPPPNPVNPVLPAGKMYAPSATALAEIPPWLMYASMLGAAHYPGVDWTIIAGQMYQETRYGELVGSAPGQSNSLGYAGILQWGPSWSRYGQDGDGDGRKDLYDPFDAAYGTADYLDALGVQADPFKALQGYSGSSPTNTEYPRIVLTQAARYRGTLLTTKPLIAAWERWIEKSWRQHPSFPTLGAGAQGVPEKVNGANAHITNAVSIPSAPPSAWSTPAPPGGTPPAQVQPGESGPGTTAAVTTRGPPSTAPTGSPVQLASVVALGDALTASAWPADAHTLLPSTRVINAGKSGSTTTDMAARFQTAVLAQHPSAVVIFGGSTDLLAERSTQAATAAVGNVNTMLAAATRANLPSIVVLIPPASAVPPALIRRYNSQLTALARTDVAGIADVYTAFTTPDGGTKPGLLVDDTTPTAAGARLIASIVTPALRGAVPPKPIPTPSATPVASASNNCPVAPTPRGGPTNGPLPPTQSQVQQAVLTWAYRELVLKIPYVYGAPRLQGDNPVSFDCSSFTQWAWYQATRGKVALPGDTVGQYPAVKAYKVPAGQEQPGDLAFFAGSLGSLSIPRHVGIVWDPGTKTMINAYNEGLPIQFNSYAVSDFVGIYRVPVPAGISPRLPPGSPPLPSPSPSPPLPSTAAVRPVPTSAGRRSSRRHGEH